MSTFSCIPIAASTRHRFGLLGSPFPYPLPVIIQSDAVLAALSKKAQSQAKDASRHLLCPTCRVRTPLYALTDGRRKCSVCGKKFNPDKKTDALRLRQCADVLLCFSINFTAQQAATLAGYRYRLVAALYAYFRQTLAAQTLAKEDLCRLADAAAYDHAVHGGKHTDTPVFGVRLFPDGTVRLDPFFAPSGADRSAYAGYIHGGKFHRFSGGLHGRDNAEQLWAWMSERLRRHHGVRKGGVGLYLKELEWKYNHRELSSEEQAIAIARQLPADFLSARARMKQRPIGE